MRQWVRISLRLAEELRDRSNNEHRTQRALPLRQWQKVQKVLLVKSSVQPTGVGSWALSGAHDRVGDNALSAAHTKVRKCAVARLFARRRYLSAQLEQLKAKALELAHYYLGLDDYLLDLNKELSTS
jgi:hypothetical protein